ncbi:MAG: LacI family transcriptional regulator [Spirochaetaceae bacterium]|nr:MAG: LacI family transcriptional regulator [Spirochaetaceae bacterium]
MNRSKPAILAFTILCLVLVVMLAWPTVRDIFDPPGNEKIVVVMKTIGPDMEFWQVVRAGIQAAAAEVGVEPVIVGPRWERDIERQMEILANVIEQEPDAILLAASDFNRLAPLAERAAERGITIVTMDSALNSTVPVSFVATDNVAAGLTAGREINRLVPPDRSVAIVSHIQGVATAIDREEGVLQALSARDPATIIGIFYAENELDRAYEIVENLILSRPDLGGIVALNENSTVGAGRAIRDLGAADHIHLVGFDNSREEIEFLEKGIVDALVVQKPFNMGYLGIKTVIDAVRGRPVEPIIHTDSVLVRQHEIFTEENQKLLFPLVQPR